MNNIEEAISKAKKMREQGLTHNKIAEMLNEEGYRTVKGLPLSDTSLNYYMIQRSKNTRKEVKKPQSYINRNTIDVLRHIRMLGLSEINRRKVLSIILDDLVAR